MESIPSPPLPLRLRLPAGPALEATAVLLLAATGSAEHSSLPRRATGPAESSKRTRASSPSTPSTHSNSKFSRQLRLAVHVALLQRPADEQRRPAHQSGSIATGIQPNSKPAAWHTSKKRFDTIRALRPWRGHFGRPKGSTARAISKDSTDLIEELLYRQTPPAAIGKIGRGESSIQGDGRPRQENSIVSETRGRTRSESSSHQPGNGDIRYCTDANFKCRRPASASTEQARSEMRAQPPAMPVQAVFARAHQDGSLLNTKEPSLSCRSTLGYSTVRGAPTI